MMYFDLFLDSQQPKSTNRTRAARAHDQYRDPVVAALKSSLSGRVNNNPVPLISSNVMPAIQLRGDESMVRLHIIESATSKSIDVPPCIAPFSCLLDGSDEWSRTVAKFFILECSRSYVPPYGGCVVEVEILHRYCDGKCEVYVGEWSQPDYSMCDNCGPRGRLIDHESVVRGAIAYALQHLMYRECPIFYDKCKTNALRVYMATCGEYVYDGPNEGFISQFEYEWNTKWRPCGEAYCCVADYEVCHWTGNDNLPEWDPKHWERYEATVAPGQGMVPYPVFECTKPGCRHFCGDLPKKVVTLAPRDEF